MTDPRKISDDRDETVAAGDFDTRAREAASKATTMAEFRKLMGGMDHQVAVALTERLGLDVPIIRKKRKESGWQAKPIPKPTAKKGAKS